MIEVDFANKILFAKKGQAHKLKNHPNLPFFITTATNVFSLRLDEKNRVYLIEPKAPLEFDRLVNIQKQVEKKLEGVTIIIADQLNAKFRPLFVRQNIPFVFKDKTLFAPMLGVKLFGHKEIKEPKKRIIDDELTPFEIKLVAGYLTGFIESKNYNLDQLLLNLSKNHYVCQKMKISLAIKHLIEMDFMSVEGLGPQRRVKFNAKDKVWEELKHRKTKRFYKRFEMSSDRIPDNAIVSGEPALAHFSNLNEPDQKHIAATNKELAKIEAKKSAKDDTTKFILEVFKEPPHLFAVKGCLNPIEIFLMFRNDPDERIQMSLEEMMSAYHLELNDGAS